MRRFLYITPPPPYALLLFDTLFHISATGALRHDIRQHYADTLIITPRWYVGCCYILIDITMLRYYYFRFDTLWHYAVTILSPLHWVVFYATITPLLRYIVYYYDFLLLDRGTMLGQCALEEDTPYITACRRWWVIISICHYMPSWDYADIDITTLRVTPLYYGCDGHYYWYFERLLSLHTYASFRLWLFCPYYYTLALHVYAAAMHYAYATLFHWGVLVIITLPYANISTLWCCHYLPFRLAAAAAAFHYA